MQRCLHLSSCKDSHMKSQQRLGELPKCIGHFVGMWLVKHLPLLRQGPQEQCFNGSPAVQQVVASRSQLKVQVPIVVQLRT